MKKTLLKLAVLSAVSFASKQVLAAGTLCSLPSAPVGSAYINAYNTGRAIPPLVGPPVPGFQSRTNFGQVPNSAGTETTCQITALAAETSPPLPGYSVVNSATRPIPRVTGGPTTAGNTIGSVLDIVWRKPAATAPATPTPMCIFGTRVSLTNTDHDTVTAGTDLFEVNDIARGGFSGSGTVGVGYFKQASGALFLYRVGRTYTSVQHRAYKFFGTLAEQQNNGVGYIDLPTIGGLATLDINGVNAPVGTFATIGGNPALQQAQVNSNWVDFTSHLVYTVATAVGSMFYVQAPCNSDSAATMNATWVKAGAISLRQTAQENTTFKRIDISGFAPPGAVIP